MSNKLYRIMFESDSEDYEKILDSMYNAGATNVEFLESVDMCPICGSEIEEGQARQDEDENIICEECFIQLQAKKKGLV